MKALPNEFVDQRNAREIVGRFLVAVVKGSKSSLKFRLSSSVDFLSFFCRENELIKLYFQVIVNKEGERNMEEQLKY